MTQRPVHVIVSGKKRRSDEFVVDDYGDDSEDAEPPLAVLDWRSDPERSFSDWRIDVVVPVLPNKKIDSGNGGAAIKTTTSYHVHKNVLVVESEYFQKLFGSDDALVVEPQAAATTIELAKQGAAAFPDFLDYMYRLGEPKFTFPNSTAMFFFGEYFGMKRLRWLARRFWKKNLQFSTLAIYYMHAGIFENQGLMKAVKEKCYECRKQIFPGSPLADIPDPQIWLNLLEKRMGSHSRKSSLLVTDFCERHDVDASIFSQMTTDSLLPVVDFAAAVELVEQERRLFQEDEDGRDALSSLQVRCIAALTSEWGRVNQFDAAFSEFLSNQSSLFVSELFKASLAAVSEKDNDS